jgi:hypothetical protein
MFVNGSGRNEQSFRGPSIDASYQVSDHLGKQLQKRRIFKISQSETRVACGGHVLRSLRPDSSTNMAATGNSCL